MHWSRLQQFLFPLKADLIHIASDTFCHEGTSSYSFPPLSVDTVGPLRNVPPWAAGKPFCCCFSFFPTCSLSGLHLLHSVLEGWHALCFFPLHLLFLFHAGEGQRWCHKLRGQGTEDRSAVTVIFKYSETQPQSQQTAALKAVYPPPPTSFSPGPSDLSIIKQLLNSLTPLEVNIWWSEIP